MISVLAWMVSPQWWDNNNSGDVYDHSNALSLCQCVPVNMEVCFGDNVHVLGNNLCNASVNACLNQNVHDYRRDYA